MELQELEAQVPPIPMDPMAALEQLMAQKKALELELAQEKKANEIMKVERDTAVADMADFEIFRPIVEQKPVSLQVWLRDKPLVTYLKAQMVKWFGPGGDPAHPDNNVSKMAKNRLDLVVEECVRFGIQVHPGTIKSRLNGPPRPSKGDANGNSEK